MRKWVVKWRQKNYCNAISVKNQIQTFYIIKPFFQDKQRKNKSEKRIN